MATAEDVLADEEGVSKLRGIMGKMLNVENLDFLQDLDKAIAAPELSQQADFRNVVQKYIAIDSVKQLVIEAGARDKLVSKANTPDEILTHRDFDMVRTQVLQLINGDAIKQLPHQVLQRVAQRRRSSVTTA